MGETIQTREGLQRSLSGTGSPLPDPDLPRLWGRRSVWYAHSRWSIAPLITLTVLAAREIGFEFAFGPVLVIAALHPICNALLVRAYRRAERSDHEQNRLDRSLLSLEVLADYLAVFALIHFTGGIHSPLTFFLIFHVILAAIQFSKARAYLFASWAVAGLWILLWFHESNWVESPAISFRGTSILHAEGVTAATVRIAALTAMFALVALITGKIMESLRRRVREVAATTVELSQANQKLRSFYRIVGSVGAERRLQPILDLVTEQLAGMFEGAAVGISLMEDEGQALRFAVAHGLPEDFIVKHPIDLQQSRFHKRVLLGETLVQGRVEEDDAHPLRSSFLEIGIRSIIVARMAVDGAPVGTVGIYSREEDRFQGIDVEFLEMTAELVAIAIEDARVNEEVEVLVRERTRLMMEVAHNLRAPLGASLGLLDLVVSGYAGPLDRQAEEHLERVVIRLRSLDETVGELLQIAKSRDWAAEIRDVIVSPSDLAREIETVFRSEAEGKGLQFVVVLEQGLPSVESGGDLLFRALENLVSNAIKYTPAGGKVTLRFQSPEADRLRIVVEDNGIGIPQAEQKRLFVEFFRASNARKLSITGTGLGLAFVKHAVERHRGHLSLQSEEGRGTTISIDLYAHRPRERSTEPVVSFPRRPV